MNYNHKTMKTQRTCEKGHIYYKSSACPTCPVCQAANKPTEGFLSLLSAPARRALESNAIHTLEELAELSEKELLKFHGLGKSSIPKLKEALQGAGMTLKEK